MVLNDYLNVFRARWKAFIAGVLVVMAIGGLQAFTAPRLYTATSTTLVTVSAVNGTGDLARGFLFSQSLVQSYAKVATQPVVLGPVIKDLRLAMTPAQLAGMVNAQVNLDTLLIDVRVTTDSPTLAASIANAVSRQLVRSAQTLLVLPSTITPTPTPTPTRNRGAKDKETARPAAPPPPPVRVVQVSEAQVPTAPASPRVPLIMTVSLALGVLLGLLFAFVRDALDTRINTAQDVARVTDAPVLGHTPLSAKRRTSRRHKLGEQARRLRAHFQTVSSPGMRSVVFTSANDDLATSLTVRNLGQQLSAVGCRTVIVDADLHRPGLSGMLGKDASTGLSEVLQGRTTWQQVVLQPDRPHLDVIPAGRPSPEAAGVIDEAALTTLVHELAQTYDAVLIKAPPLLRIADGLVLARVADGVVVVTDGPAMKRRLLADEIASLKLADAATIGVVLAT
jgi:capsular exopolysaccharide synthesis family protein